MKRRHVKAFENSKKYKHKIEIIGFREEEAEMICILRNMRKVFKLKLAMLSVVCKVLRDGKDQSAPYNHVGGEG